MFETLMKPGGHRIDYLNDDARGMPDAFGFYVYGDLPDEVPYSTAAKRQLYAGLDVINKYLGQEKLVAVYVDVNAPEVEDRLAYVQMKEDLRAGLFRRVFTFVSLDTSTGPMDMHDLCRLSRELDGFELITFDQGLYQPVIDC